MELTRSSIVLSKLAAIDSADATKYLTSAINGYAKAGITATEVIDKLIKV